MAVNQLGEVRTQQKLTSLVRPRHRRLAHPAAGYQRPCRIPGAPAPEQDAVRPLTWQHRLQGGKYDRTNPIDARLARHVSLSQILDARRARRI